MRMELTDRSKPFVLHLVYHLDSRISAKSRRRSINGGVALGQVPRLSAIFCAALCHPPRHTDIANTQAKMNRGNAGKRDGACMTPPYGLQDMDMKMW